MLIRCHACTCRVNDVATRSGLTCLQVLKADMEELGDLTKSLFLGCFGRQRACGHEVLSRAWEEGSWDWTHALFECNMCASRKDMRLWLGPAGALDSLRGATWLQITHRDVLLCGFAFQPSRSSVNSTVHCLVHPERSLYLATIYCTVTYFT
ncbi:hypothetical protein NDU88_012660 [Pleurodeles waltl]|uniref:Uncharacterized protein n=1 Tax=Pleurodeles waltl TaxID=8319 RepID=A0AAV7R6F9_PLEWA|nr:hypothetical protein NDU88_012660 [Pleurodeles waltl]